MVHRAGFVFHSPEVVNVPFCGQLNRQRPRGFLFGDAMLVHKGHRIQLQPSQAQQVVFRQWAGAYRWAYNYGLERKKAEHEATGKSPGAYSLMQEVVALKKTDEYAWLRDVAKSIPRIALMHLEEAYNNFFRRCKDGAAKKGYPRWKSRKRSKVVLHLEPDTVTVEGKRIRIPKLGWVKMTKPLRFEGELVGTVAISERAGKWYASFNVQTEHVPAEKQGGAVGIDLGVATLATLSDGTTFENPKAIRRHGQLLARAQRQMARKQKGSNRWHRAKLRVARIQKHIADVRADAIHKATRYVADTYSLVALEDLNVSGMVRNHHLAKSVSDAAMSEFGRQVGYKVGWEQGEVTTISRWFPSSKLCGACGCINDDLTLADRTWTCDCGAVHNRDQNAAANILAEALRIHRGFPVTARGGDATGRPAKREQTCQVGLA